MNCSKNTILLMAIGALIVIGFNLFPQYSYGAIFNDVSSTIFVSRVYNFLLERDADLGGLAFWKGLIDNRTSSRKDVILGIYRSEEYKVKHRISELSDGDFVILLYKNLLGRDASSIDLNYWLGQLRIGKTRNQVAQNFIYSPEFEIRFSNYLNPGVPQPPVVVPPAVSGKQSPKGTLDSADCKVFTGWTCDPDAYAQPLNVDFYFNGPGGAGGQFLGSVLADREREVAVGNECGGSRRHGFSYSAPDSLQDGQPHKIYAHAINIGSSGGNPVLNGSPKTIQCSGGNNVGGGSSKYSIGAWYFTAWNPLNSAHIPWAKITYGREDVWAGTRDYAEGKDKFNLNLGPNYYSDRKPLIGYYDMSQQEVVDSHIQKAVQYGLDYFNIYWYWSSVKAKESGVSAPMKQLIASLQKNKIKFGLAPIAENVPLDQWKNKLVPFLVNNYISDPSYLRTQDGRPIIFEFQSGLNIVDKKEGLDYLRAAIKNHPLIGVNPLILGLAHEKNTVSTLSDSKKKFGYDGFFCFSYPALGGSIGASQYSSLISSWSSYINPMKSFLNIPCANSGFDRRPWFGVGGLRGEGAPSSPNQDFYYVGITADLFKQHLLNMKAYLDDPKSNDLSMLTVYAWNEWGEGGFIEPDVINKNKKLETIKEVFGLVGKPQARMSEFVSQNVTDFIEAGKAFTVSVKMKNIGTLPWKKSSNFSLGSVNPTDSSVWGISRIPLPVEEVRPGDIVNFVFDVTAPMSAGKYNMQWKMLEEGVERFGDLTTNMEINVGVGENCDITWSGKRFTGLHDKVGLNTGDARFLCFNSRFYECGWELNDASFASKVTNNQKVGSWICNLSAGVWKL